MILRSTFIYFQLLLQRCYFYEKNQIFMEKKRFFTTKTNFYILKYYNLYYTEKIIVKQKSIKLLFDFKFTFS